MKQAHGFSLIELIVFISVLAILTVTTVKVQSAFVSKSELTRELAIASASAQARLELIIMKRYLDGFTSFSDICPGPSGCSVPSGYAISNVNIANNWLGDSNYKVITVTVTGPNSLSFSYSTMVANY